MPESDPRLDDLREIRSMMEKSSKFLSLSGLSGIVAGLLGTGGTIAAWYIVSGGGEEIDKIRAIAGVSAAVLILAIGTSIMLTARLAWKKEQSWWGPAAKSIVVEMATPLLAGGVLCILLAFHRMYAVIPGSLLIFYGLALVSAAKATRVEVRYFGWVEIVLGLFGMFFLEHAFVYCAIGFGLAHILYGALIYFKYEL